MEEKPPIDMPGYLCSDLPQPTHSGKKSKAGFPKWKAVSEPISWFAMIRDTTKRF